jgi:hypothetical protein
VTRGPRTASFSSQSSFLVRAQEALAAVSLSRSSPTFIAQGCLTPWGPNGYVQCGAAPVSSADGGNRTDVAENRAAKKKGYPRWAVACFSRVFRGRRYDVPVVSAVALFTRKAIFTT